MEKQWEDSCKGKHAFLVLSEPSLKYQGKEDIKMHGNRMPCRPRLGYWCDSRTLTCLACSKQNTTEHYLIDCDRYKHERRDLKRLTKQQYML